MAATVKFKAKLQQAGKTATGFEVPAKAVADLGSHKRPPVKVTVNGYTYRNTVASMGKTFMIGVSAEHREKSGVRAGDVLLLHDADHYSDPGCWRGTVAALPAILDQIQAAGLITASP